MLERNPASTCHLTPPISFVGGDQLRNGLERRRYKEDGALVAGKGPDLRLGHQRVTMLLPGRNFVARPPTPLNQPLQSKWYRPCAGCHRRPPWRVDPPVELVRLAHLAIPLIAGRECFQVQQYIKRNRQLREERADAPRDDQRPEGDATHDPLGTR